MLLLTQGDPASIAPDITVQAWKKFRRHGPPFIYVGDPQLIEQAIPCRKISREFSSTEIEKIFSNALPVIPLQCLKTPVPGQGDPQNGAITIKSIRLCTELALSRSDCAVVTNPISKIILQKAGFKHAGHTSFLAQLCRREGQEVMAMVTPQLMTVPVTTHLSLRQAINALTPALLKHTAQVTFHELQDRFGCKAPRMVCTGLNPHAGEDGLLGTEEEMLIKPTLRTLAKEGIPIDGPFAADTLFIEENRKKFDVALCMYHDQALIPVKTLDLHHGVNTTLGLPIIRTSPDHGTAFPLAGQGRADPRSLEESLLLANRLQNNRNTYHAHTQTPH